MRILVFADSHGGMSFMRECTRKLRPDVLIHLGDFFDDGRMLAEDFPHIPTYQVPGNCDRFRCPPDQPETLVTMVGGVYMYLTHGHRQRVKDGLSRLIQDAQACHAAAALFGHTHEAYCACEPNGMWVVNPGCCGGYGASAAVMETDAGKIISCRILRRDELEETL